MILRKAPSAFLRALRSLPPDALPALPEKTLSKRQQKRLEDAVFARIRAEEKRTVFDTDPASENKTSANTHAYDDSPYEMTVIGERGAWKRYLKTALAACLCFAVVVTAILFRGDIALYFADHSWLVDTADVTDHEDTQAIHEWTSDEALLAEPPENAADAYHMQVTSRQITEDSVTLQLRLTSADGTRFEGTAIQYSRVALELWDSDVRRWILKYEDTLPYQPEAQIMADDIHFNLIGLGAVNEAEMTLKLPMDLTDYQGVWRISLDGLTLVRDALPGETAEFGMTAEPFCEGVVWALFSSEEKPKPSDTEPAEALPPRDTVTPPPESAQLPLFASEDSTLMLSRVTADGAYVTLDVVLNLPGGNPDGYAVYYRTEETELWNHEKQIWEGKHGTGFGEDDTVFAKMLCAGEVHFTVDQTSGNTFDTVKVNLGDPGEYRTGWYRTTLTGLVLVREAHEGEEDDFSNLVCEELDAGAVSVIYHID